MKVTINSANPIYRKIESTRGKSPNAVSVIPKMAHFRVSHMGNVDLNEKHKGFARWQPE